MKYLFILFLLFFLTGNSAKASDTSVNIKFLDETFFLKLQDSISNDFYVQVQSDYIAIGVQGRQVKFKRGKAILFTVFTGLFGGHRIYFGTHQRTPIIYSITFGGLGILPLIDLVNIIFTKDLSKFEHKSQIIMW